MRRNIFLASSGTGIALLAWAFSTRGKEGMLIFFLGAAILLCTLVVGGVRSAMQTAGQTPTTNNFAILGALIGLFLGGFFGARIGFGRVMISVLNPDLPERDFGTLFGSIGGGILGAFFLALLCGTLQMLIVRSKRVEPVEDSQESLPNSRGDTS
jgi:uncharacterized SAM-binding protein YcdF (DUF218 family)